MQCNVHNIIPWTYKQPVYYPQYDLKNLDVEAGLPTDCPPEATFLFLPLKLTSESGCPPPTPSTSSSSSSSSTSSSAVLGSGPSPCCRPTIQSQQKYSLHCSSYSPPPRLLYNLKSASSGCSPVRRSSCDGGTQRRRNSFGRAPAVFWPPGHQELLEAELEFLSRASVRC